jgi:uncharacterized protein (DUF924 family)
MSPTRGAPTVQTDWADEVLRFWFTELPRQQWFAGGATLDEQVRSRFLDVHRMVAAAPEDVLLADAKTTLAAMIVLDLWQPQIASSRGAKQEQASIEQQLEVLRAGKVRTGEDIGAGWIGTTEDAIKKT